MNNGCTIYIVRHGETVWNIEGKLQGQKDSALTEKGIEQAREVAMRFKNVHFDAIFSSDLLRAKRTAEIIALDRKIAVETRELIRERNFGNYEGRLYQELDEKISLMKDLNTKQRFSFKIHPEVESDEEIANRFVTFLREAAVAYEGKTILIVSHGGTMRALLIKLGFSGEWPNNFIENTGYIKILSDGIDFFVKETHGISNLKYED